MNKNPDSTRSDNAETPFHAVDWRSIVTKYQNQDFWRSSWQVVNTLVPYAALWYLMHLALSISWWLTIPLVILAGGFLVRTFIIFHDCGHGSFFKSRRANNILGFVTGVLCFTPYFLWRWEHSVHHASSGDLNKRGLGDVWTLTVQEYLEASRWKRFAYRLARNPIVLFVIAPLYLFLIHHRIPTLKAPDRERESAYWTNLALLLLIIAMGWWMGFKAYLLLQLAVIAVSGSAGIWLFYVQHQFEGVYWERSEKWDYATASIKGSSFYKLPRILQWFTGNIGFHHIHHLSPRIPNYRLEKCHEAEPLFQTVTPITLLSSFKSLTFRLWDEQHHRLVGYDYVRMLRKQQRQTARG